MPRKTREPQARPGPQGRETSPRQALEALGEGLNPWIEQRAAGLVVRAEPHAGGSNRIAWQVDVEGGGERRALFLMLETPGAGVDGGNARDGALLAALGDTPVPVPALLARDGPAGALLMERVAGCADAPTGAELEPVLSDLMRHLAALHRLTPQTRPIPELPVPGPPEALALAQLAGTEARYRATPAARHPLVDFGLGWLRREVPRDAPGPVLVHGDAGPGNLIHAGGRVRALVDWEIAHWGDPMEDLAALATRDMSTPIGPLERRLADYEAAGGARVDLDRLRYYRALVLIRNSALIGLTLAGAAASRARDALRPFALLLRRAAAQALCEATGHPFAPEAAPPAPPDASLDADELWIPALASLTCSACAEQRDLMGPLADRLLQPLPATDRATA